MLIGDKDTDIKAGQNAGVRTNILYIGSNGVTAHSALACHVVTTLNEAKLLL